MSRKHFALLLLILAAFMTACGTATPTSAPQAATEEVVEPTGEAAEPTEEAAEPTEETGAVDAALTQAADAAAGAAGTADAALTQAADAAASVSGTADAALTQAAGAGDAALTQAAEMAAGAAGTADAALTQAAGAGDAALTQAAEAVAGVSGTADAALTQAAGAGDAALTQAAEAVAGVSGTADAALTQAAGAGDAALTQAAGAADAALTQVGGAADAALTQAAEMVAGVSGTADAALTQAAEALAGVSGTADAALTQAAVALQPTLEPTAVPGGDLIAVRLQLQWVAQSQFAGYYAAVAQGFYEEEGLDVTLLEGAVDIVPQTVVASGGAEFGIAWVPKVLASREQDADLVNIAQVFQRSGTVDVSFAASGIETIEDLRGMRVGAWGFGNEHELFAALRAAGIDPNNAEDVEVITQNFDMSALLSGEIDAAMAMTYNEYAQVLEQVNPDTGELYQPDELNVINFNDVGTAMLQDHIFSSAEYLAGETDGVSNEDIAVRFIRASLKGWIYCRDNFEACVDIVLENGPTLGRGHMTWQLNEINKLIWPSPAGVGIMDEDLWAQTVQIALDGEVITEEPSEGAYRTDLAQAAVDSLEGEDVTGEDWTPEEVEITPGGE